MATLAAPLFFLSYMQLRQLYIKHTLEERMERSLLKTVFIPRQDWSPVNNDETLVDGKLFDVDEMHVTKNGMFVTGVFDEEETAVMQQMDKSCAANHSKETPVFAQFFQLLDGLFFHATSVQPLIGKSVHQYFQNLILNLPHSYKQVISPPPQVFA